MITLLPHIEIAADTLRSLWTYTRAAKGEISAIGEVQWDGQHILIPNAIHFLRQSNSAASTVLDQDAVADLCLQYQVQGKSWTRLRFWFHTHFDMAAFFSFQDDKTIWMLSDRFPDLFVAAVFNTRGETEWRIVRHTQELNFKFTIPGGPPSEADVALARPEISQFVTEEHWVSESDWSKDWKKRGHGRWGIYE